MLRRCFFLLYVNKLQTARTGRTKWI